MKKAIGIIIFIGMLFVSVNTVQASVLNFESIFTGYGMNIPANYGGFNWDSNFYSISEGTFYGGNTITFPSSTFGVFNGYGVLTSTITRNSNFDFQGANFVPWLEDNQIYAYSSTSITMKGYNDSTLVGEVTHNLTNSFDYYAANFSNINKLELIASVGDPARNNERWWLMDNFTYNGGGVATPEPTSMVLLGLGSLAMAVIKRKKKLI